MMTATLWPKRIIVINSSSRTCYPNLNLKFAKFIRFFEYLRRQCVSLPEVIYKEFCVILYIQTPRALTSTL